jgi:hypothetical protein
MTNFLAFLGIFLVCALRIAQARARAEQRQHVLNMWNDKRDEWLHRL